MNAIWPSFAGWLLHCLVGGGSLLLLAVPLLAACRQPARRQRMGELALLAALVLPVLSLGPSWISLPLPSTAWLASPPLASGPPARLPAVPMLSSEDPAFPYADRSDSIGHRRQNPENVVEQQRMPARPAFSTPEVVSRVTDSAASDFSERAGRTGWASATSTSEMVSALTFLDLTRLASLMGLAYVAASGLLLGRWLLGHFVLWRLLRAAQSAPPAIDHLFATMARGQPRRPRLLVSGRLQVPMSCGLVRPRVVVPANLLEPKAARTLRWVFAHELTHLQRGDARSCVLFGLGQLLYFYLPWFWWLRRQVRLCQEYIADAAAAEQTADPEDYAQFLISLTQAPAVPLGALGVLGNSSDLFRRVTMLLQSPLRVEKSCPRWWSLGTAGGLLGLALFVSGIGVRADAAARPDEREPATTAIVNAGDEPNSDENNGEPVDKKQTNSRPAVEKVLRDLEELLKVLPAAVDAEQVKKLERRLEELKGEGLLEERQDLHNRGSLKNPELSPLDGFVRWTQQRNEGRLGVQVQKPSPVLADQLDLPKGHGLVIETVVAKSAAAKAGLKKHDVLLEFNGKPVPNEVADFVKLLNEVKADTPVEAIVLRKGQKVTIKGLSLPEGRSLQPFHFEAMPGTQPFRFQRGGPPGFMVNPPNFQFHAFGAPGERGVITTIVRTKDSFTTRYQEGSLIITLTGSVTDGKSKVKQIQVQDGGKNETYKSADKVPEQYRDKVKNLIEMSEKNNLKIEVGDQSLKNLHEQEHSAQTNINQVIITLEKGSAAALAEAMKLMIPQRRRNPVRIVFQGRHGIGSAKEGGRPFRNSPLSQNAESNLPGSLNLPITLNAFGNKLVAMSDDPDALRLVSELYRLLQTPAGEGDYEVIGLQYVRATEAARLLNQAFNRKGFTEDMNPYQALFFRHGEKAEEPRIRVVPDTAANSLLVQANPLDMILVRALVKNNIDIKNTGSGY